jgi:hypothetical protein
MQSFLLPPTREQAFRNAGMPSISHRRRDKHMVRERGNILPAGGNKHGRQFGHLRLLASESRQASSQPGDRQIAPRREGATTTARVTSETFMPKRQHQDNRKYKIDDGAPRRVPRPKPSTTPIIKREFMLTPSADDTLFEAVRVLSRATHTNLSNSHFLRVLLKGCRRCDTTDRASSIGTRQATKAGERPRKPGREGGV